MVGRLLLNLPEAAHVPPIGDDVPRGFDGQSAWSDALSELARLSTVSPAWARYSNSAKAHLRSTDEAASASSQGARLHVASLPFHYLYYTEPPSAALPNADPLETTRWSYGDLWTKAETLARGVTSLDISGVTGASDGLFLRLVHATVPDLGPSRSILMRGSLLTELDISFCMGLSPQALRLGFGAMPSLKVVRAAGVPALSSKALITLAQTATQLEFLDISGSSTVDPDQFGDAQEGDPVYRQRLDGLAEGTSRFSTYAFSMRAPHRTPSDLSAQSCADCSDGQDSVLDATSISEAVALLTNLHTLKLAGRGGFAADAMTYLGNALPGLAALDLSYTDVTDDCLHAWVSDSLGLNPSEHLMLLESSLNGALPCAWIEAIRQRGYWPVPKPPEGKRLTCLRRLSLAHCTQVTDAGLGHLAGCVPLLTVLDLSYTGVTGKLEPIGSYDGRLVYSALQPAGLELLLETLPYLQRLSLDGNDTIDDSVLYSLMSAPRKAYYHVQSQRAWPDPCDSQPARPHGAGAALGHDIRFTSLTHLRVTKAVGLTDRGMEQLLLASPDLIELHADASGAGNRTARRFLQIQQARQESAPTCPRSYRQAESKDKPEPMIPPAPTSPIISMADRHVPTWKNLVTRPRRARAGKAYATARYSGGQEAMVPPAVLRGLATFDAPWDIPMRHPRPSLMELLWRLLFGSGRSPHGRNGFASRQEVSALLGAPAPQYIWLLPEHQNLLQRQRDLNEHDEGRVVVTDLGSWEQVREHGLAVRTLESAATCETADVARELARRRAEREKAQALAHRRPPAAEVRDHTAPSLCRGGESGLPGRAAHQ